MSGERQLWVNRTKIENVIELALEARANKTHFFSGEFIPPELTFIEKLKAHGKRIKDEKFAINGLFLTSVFIRGGNTSTFFQGIDSRDSLERFEWLFKPEVVVKRTKESVANACMNFFKPQTYSIDALPKWYYNCAVLADKYNGDVRNFFHSFEDDAEKVAKGLYVEERLKTDKKLKIGAFLGYGKKLSNLTIQWINQYGLYPFKNARTFGIPADFQIGRILIQTEGVKLGSPVSSHIILSDTIEPIVRKIAKENDLDIAQISESLWTIGSSGCSKRDHGNCPLEKVCKSLVSSEPYQKLGVFDPKDNGRYR